MSYFTWANQRWTNIRCPRNVFSVPLCLLFSSFDERIWTAIPINTILGILILLAKSTHWPECDTGVQLGWLQRPLHINLSISTLIKLSFGCFFLTDGALNILKKNHSNASVLFCLWTQQITQNNFILIFSHPFHMYILEPYQHKSMKFFSHSGGEWSTNFLSFVTHLYLINSSIVTNNNKHYIHEKIPIEIQVWPFTSPFSCRIDFDIFHMLMHWVKTE